MNSIFNPIIAKNKNDELKLQFKNFYDTEITKLSAIETLDEISALFKEIIDDVQRSLLVWKQKSIKCFKKIKTLED